MDKVLLACGWYIGTRHVGRNMSTRSWRPSCIAKHVDGSNRFILVWWMHDQCFDGLPSRSARVSDGKGICGCRARLWGCGDRMMMSVEGIAQVLLASSLRRISS